MEGSVKSVKSVKSYTAWDLSRLSRLSRKSLECTTPMSTYLEIAKQVEALLPKTPVVVLGKAPVAENPLPPFPKNAGGVPVPLAQHYPCVVCEGTDRWEDRGIWRCRHCWPDPLTASARAAAQAEAARLAAQGRPRHLTTQDQHCPDGHRWTVLDNFTVSCLACRLPLPPCATCGELRHWHDHATDQWHCWTCLPPASPAAAALTGQCLLQELPPPHCTAGGYQDAAGATP
jgi:hypothetical protein